MACSVSLPKAVTARLRHDDKVTVRGRVRPYVVADLDKDLDWFDNGKIVSTITSGNYGHHLGGAIGMGYVPCAGESEADVLASRYEIEIAGIRVKAEASLAPMYDPKAERVRA